MVRWNQVRWSLGLSVLAALVVAGCGAAGKQPEHSLHAAAEQHLLNLVDSARADVADHNGPAAQANLGLFMAEVDSLQAKGELTRSTASSLHQQASATASEIASQRRITTTQDVASQPRTATPTTSATSPPPKTPATSSPTTKTPPALTRPAADQKAVHSPGHGYGHRFGHGGHGNPHRGDGGDNGGGND